METKCPNCPNRMLEEQENHLMKDRQKEYVCVREPEEKNDKGKITKKAKGCGYKMVVPIEKEDSKKADKK